MDEQRRAFEALWRIMRAAGMVSRWLPREYWLTGPPVGLLTEIGRRQAVPLGVLTKATFTGSPTATGILDRWEKPWENKVLRCELAVRPSVVASMWRLPAPDAARWILARH